MTPKQQNPLALLGGITRGASSLRNLAMGGAGEELSKCQTILLSRRVLDSVIQKFNLMNVYDFDELDKTRKELQGNVQVGLGDEDVSIVITVYDTDRYRAADMANYFVEMLNLVYLDLSVNEARSNREFLERRYKQNLADLKSAEDSLRTFQERHGIYSVPDQIKASVEAAAMLESKIVVKDVQLDILQKTATEENPQRQLLELEMSALRQQQQAMKKGSAQPKDRSIIFVPFEHAPEIGIQYLRHYRELELQSKLLELLLPLFEQAKIEEQRNTPSVLLLDTAVPADRATKPKRMLILAATVILSFLLACGMAIFFEGLRKSKDEHKSFSDKLSFIGKELRWKNLFR
jgi:uncharacterized protein involved in exopolysaccharide biosynthesis